MGFGLDINSRLKSVNAPIDLKWAASNILSRLLNERGHMSTNPIVFIGHGYGNVVIEELLFGELLNTVEEASRLDLVQSTAAVTMFGAPFESFDNIISWATETFDIHKASTKLFDARKGTEHIPDRIWNRFFEGAEKHQIATFGYFERGQPKSSKSSDINSNKYSDRLDRRWLSDHDIGGIARFVRPEDVRFRNISKAISEFLAVHQLLICGKDIDDAVMEELLKSSVDFNFKNRKQQTVLHVAVERGYTRLVQHLVNSDKVDLDLQDEAGNTALHIAVTSKHHHNSPEMVYNLLKAGAQSGVKNNLGKSAQSFALEKGILPQIKDLLRKPPLVEGPSGPRKLVRGQPANKQAQAACQNTGMVVREIFSTASDKPDKHLPVYKTVHDLIYTDDKIGDFFQATHDNEASNALCRWYHVPMNNMAWVQDLFAKLEMSVWPWPKPHKRSKLHHGRYMSPEATKLPGLQRASRTISKDDWVMFMPYISYESSARQQRLAEVIKRTSSSAPKPFALPNLPLSGPRLKPSRTVSSTLGYILRNEDPEVLALKGYLNDQNHNENQHLTLHIRRTLDQSYYYMLKDTSYRDKTQVVSRWVKTEWPDQKDHNILMVDQLWLWFIKGKKDGEPDTIITSFPSREGAEFQQSSREVDDLQGSVLGDDNRKSISTSMDLVSRILSVCCNAFDRHQHVESVNFLQFFESAIGRAEEDQTRLFRRFRRRAKWLHSLHEMNRTYSQNRSMLLKKLLDILKESKLLKEIKDILDEIKMIKSVLKDQTKVVNALQSMVETRAPFASTTSLADNENKFGDVLNLLNETECSFDLMEVHAKEVEKGLEHLLDLKQKQANLWEARSSREGAEAAARQGSTILVFTVVTIIFLPLSFMASFFALGISIFPKTDGENNFAIGWVSALLFGISFAVSIPFVLLAFNIDKFKIAWIRMKHSANKNTAFLFLKPLRSSHRIPSARVRDTGGRWYKEWIDFIAKHDLPFKPDGEMSARLRREVDGEPMGTGRVDEWNDSSDSSSEGEGTSDEEELELMTKQQRRQSDLLARMNGRG
ncbi:hypothetical protein SLS56_009428 [Neofusicoccum ribis]|uniref:Ankyrin repeat protein n=1 Tax=Neofusicoccum ribis TaxID=45134 RepID=A0ABR3SHA7_9PEZI